MKSKRVKLSSPVTEPVIEPVTEPVTESVTEHQEAVGTSALSAMAEDNTKLAKQKRTNKDKQNWVKLTSTYVDEQTDEILDELFGKDSDEKSPKLTTKILSPIKFSLSPTSPPARETRSARVFKKNI
jgi:hypothetical protein